MKNERAKKTTKAKAPANPGDELIKAKAKIELLNTRVNALRKANSAAQNDLKQSRKSAKEWEERYFEYMLKVTREEVAELNRKVRDWHKKRDHQLAMHRIINKLETNLCLKCPHFEADCAFEKFDQSTRRTICETYSLLREVGVGEGSAVNIDLVDQVANDYLLN